MNYIATFTHFLSRTRIFGKGNLFDFATIFTQIAALGMEAVCSEGVKQLINFLLKL